MSKSASNQSKQDVESSPERGFILVVVNIYYQLPYSYEPGSGESNSCYDSEPEAGN